MSNFIRNIWYVGAFSSDVKENALFPRVVLGTAVVFFRDVKGGIQAINDRCPHRFAPLHLGKLKDGTVQCPYHGLQFDGTGRCVYNPHGDGAIPKAAFVERYPVYETRGLIWIWMGDPAQADISRVPDFADLFEMDTRCLTEGYLLNQARYDLVCDNLMDLSHADYLHPDLLSSSGGITQIGPQLYEENDAVISKWNWTSNTPLPLMAMLVEPGTSCRQELIVKWLAPSIFRISYRMQAEGWERSHGINSAHCLTPETDTTTHYFLHASRDYMVDDAKYTEIARDMALNAFANEDSPILNQIQKAMGGAEFWSLKPVMLSADAGGVRVRRKIEELLARESVN